MQYYTEVAFLSNIYQKKTMSYANPQVNVLDLGQMIRLVGTDRPTLLELFTVFIRTTGDNMRQLRQEVAAGEWQKAGRLCHTIRGAATTMGAGRLAHALELAEQRIKRGVALASDFDPVFVEVDRVIEALNAEMANGLPTLRDFRL